LIICTSFHSGEYSWDPLPVETAVPWLAREAEINGLGTLGIGPGPSRQEIVKLLKRDNAVGRPEKFISLVRITN
jgi:hypothetical protein